MNLYICEKPSVGIAFAKAFNLSKKDGYFEGNGMMVSWCFGHLVELKEPHDYNPNYKNWVLEDLPIIPSPFELKLKTGVSTHFNLLKQLMSSADTVICATDNDREGDLIFHYVAELAKIKKYKRILPNDLSPKGIKDAMSKMVDQRINVVRSAECRSQADWLLGINATRAMTIASGIKIPVGRVQTPTLVLVAEAFLDNRDFKSKDFYKLELTLSKSNTQFVAKRTANVETEAEANLIKEKGTVAVCKDAIYEQKKENPPLPYYLSTLQVDCARFGLSPKQTLDITQGLYEKHKMVTYPRTDSGYLTENIFSGILQNIKEGALYLGVVEMFSDKSLNQLPKYCVNDAKAGNHHGIIPTGNYDDKELSEKEKKVFRLIAARFIAAFGPICTKNSTELQFDVNGESYVSKGVVIERKGWRNIYEDDEDNGEEIQELPKVTTGERLDILDKAVIKDKTKAPALLTEAKLIQRMKSVGKKIDDEILRKALRDNALRTGGLGTEATRAAIIDGLLKNGLMIKKGKSLMPSEIGLQLYEKVKELNVGSPILTAKWELALDKIANGEVQASKFMTEMYRYVQTSVEELKQSGKAIKKEMEYTVDCPKCRKKMEDIGLKIACSACSIEIWKTVYGYKLSNDEMKEIIENRGTSKKITGFRMKEKVFNGYITMLEDYTLSVRGDRMFEDLKCPKCQGHLKTNDYGIFCEHGDVKIFRKFLNKKLTDQQLKSLLNNKIVTLNGLENKEKKKSNAKIKFVNNRIVFVK